jgi:hypothetical protein
VLPDAGLQKAGDALSKRGFLNKNADLRNTFISFFWHVEKQKKNHNKFLKNIFSRLK